MTGLAEVQERTFASATAVTRASYPLERRLDADSLARYLDRRRFAAVATVRPNGRPHVAMSSYVRSGTVFWLPTVGGSVRERNIRHQPWASLVVTEGDHDEHVVVLIEGPAGAVAPAEVPTDVAARVAEPWVSGWLRVTAERVLSYAAQGVELT